MLRMPEAKLSIQVLYKVLAREKQREIAWGKKREWGQYIFRIKPREPLKWPVYIYKTSCHLSTFLPPPLMKFNAVYAVVLHFSRCFISFPPWIWYVTTCGEQRKWQIEPLDPKECDQVHLTLISHLCPFYLRLPCFRIHTCHMFFDLCCVFRWVMFSYICG